MSGAALTEASERFHRTGPEWGADQLTSADNTQDQPTLDELAHALAFWAARARSVPPAAGPGAAVEVLDRAVAHGDEHVIKFTDTAAEVYARTGQPDALAAALRVGTLIPSPRA